MKPLFLICLVITLTAIIAYTLMKNPHDFEDGKCPACHVDVQKRPKELTKGITELCLECHKKQSQRSSHPVDIQPRTVKVPADLPLKDGLVTCNTCHNLHDDRYTVLGEKTYFLRRRVADKEFCLSCHKSVKTDNKHIEMISVAHLRSKYTVTNKAQLIDSMSMDCIGCHDGTLGRSILANLGQGLWSHGSNQHPIGVNYRESRMKRGSLVPMELVNKKIRFFGGRIGCGTCHDIYSGIPKQLVMSNEGSRLCLACHDK